jgi:hypothetical protein
MPWQSLVNIESHNGLLLCDSIQYGILKFDVGSCGLYPRPSDVFWIAVVCSKRVVLGYICSVWNRFPFLLCFHYLWAPHPTPPLSACLTNEPFCSRSALGKTEFRGLLKNVYHFYVELCTLSLATFITGLICVCRSKWGDWSRGLSFWFWGLLCHIIHRVVICVELYRVIKKSLCTWWLQYKKRA